jgi:hypothetical protein
MKHRKMVAFGLLVLATVVLGAAFSGAEAASPPRYEAELAGPDVEIDIERAVGHYVVIERSAGHYLDPEAETAAVGTAYFKLLPSGMQFRVMVSRLVGPTEVTLRHVIDRGGEVEDEVIAVLWSGNGNSMNGRLAGGTLRDEDLRGPLAGLGLLGLARDIRAGNVYVVVSTAQYPKGEIGGPLLPVTLDVSKD